MTTMKTFFLQFRAHFSNFWKRAWENSPPSLPLPPSLYLRDWNLTHKLEFKLLIYIENCFLMKIGI